MFRVFFLWYHLRVDGLEGTDHTSLCRGLLQTVCLCLWHHVKMRPQVVRIAVTACERHMRIQQDLCNTELACPLNYDLCRSALPYTLYARWVTLPGGLVSLFFILYFVLGEGPVGKRRTVLQNPFFG